VDTICRVVILKTGIVVIDYDKFKEIKLNLSFLFKKPFPKFRTLEKVSHVYFEASSSITVGSNTHSWGNEKHQGVGAFIINPGATVNILSVQIIRNGFFNISF
jgi:hypothetical protein